jgi:hypothetical protein
LHPKLTNMGSKRRQSLRHRRAANADATKQCPSYDQADEAKARRSQVDDNRVTLPASSDGGRSGSPGTDREIRVHREDVNTVLVVVAVLAATIYYYRHWRPYFEHVFVELAGLSIGALVLLSRAVIESSWKSNTGERAKAIAKILLLSRWTTWLGGLALGICVGLFLVTRSLYLSYENGTDEKRRFEISVLRDGKPFAEWPRLQISPAKRVDGRTWLGSYTRGELTFEMRNPPGFDAPEPRPFSRWTRIYLQAPRDIPLPELHLLHIVPGAALLRILPQPGVEPPKRFYVRVRTGTGETVLRDWRGGIISTGAEQVHLPDRIDDATVMHIAVRFGRQFMVQPAPEQEMARLAENGVQLESPRFQLDDHVVVEAGFLRSDGSLGPPIASIASFQVGHFEEKIVFLERNDAL